MYPKKKNIYIYILWSCVFLYNANSYTLFGFEVAIILNNSIRLVFVANIISLSLYYHFKFSFTLLFSSQYPQFPLYLLSIHFFSSLVKRNCNVSYICVFFFFLALIYSIYLFIKFCITFFL